MLGQHDSRPTTKYTIHWLDTHHARTSTLPTPSPTPNKQQASKCGTGWKCILSVPSPLSNQTSPNPDQNQNQDQEPAPEPVRPQLRAQTRLELDREPQSVHNVNMTGSLLNYLLSFLLPLSPMLCGHCQPSNSLGRQSNSCCSSICAVGKIENSVAKPSDDNGPSAKVTCQSLQPVCTPRTPRKPLDGELRQCELQPCERLSDASPQRTPRPLEPCRHEHCRSAICGQSAIGSRPAAGTSELTGQPLSLDHPSDNALLSLALAAALQALSGTPPCPTPPRGTPVNSGPSGRAARIAYASWLI